MIGKREDLVEPLQDPFKPLAPDDLSGGLHALYSGIVGKADQSLTWYRAARRSKRRWSSLLRFLAIVLFSIAGLVPVLRAAGFDPPKDQLFGMEFGQTGYLSAALAAAFLGLDKFFGFSSGWIRYTLADSSIRKALAEFQMNWILANACLEHDAEERRCCRKRLHLLKDFSLRINDLVEDETRQWAGEFQSSLALLDKAAKDAQEAIRPGAVSVTLRRGAGIDSMVTITLNGQPRQQTQSDSALLLGIIPGPRLIGATGTRPDGTSVQDNKTVTVAAGGTASVELTLPV